LYRHIAAGQQWVFADLADLMAKASPLRSGDMLAGLGAQSATQRVAARMALADTPLAAFLSEALVPYEEDEVTRLIIDTHDRGAFRAISHLTVGGFRDWLLASSTTGAQLQAIARGEKKPGTETLRALFDDTRPVLRDLKMAS
jgi:ethanolamine ammonia-lyase large subunit